MHGTMHRAALHLRELNDNPLVSFAFVLHKGVTVSIQDGRCLFGLLVGGNNLGSIF